MRPLFASPPADETAPTSPPRDEVALRFAEAVAAGHTIAFVVAKDPEAAAVYYFRDAARALATYERLARLSSRPLVATIPPEAGGLGSALLDASRTLRLCGLGWLADALGREGSPGSTPADAGLALPAPSLARAAARPPAS